MSFYKVNMKAIENNKKFLYNKINETKHSDKSDADILIGMSPTIDGNTAITVTKGSHTHRLNSLYSPDHEADRWATQYDMKNIGIVASLFGLGNGRFAQKLMNKLEGRGALLIYEPCRYLFFYVLEHYDITDILSAPNVSITIEGINDIEFTNMLHSHVDWINIRSQIACNHPQYDLVFMKSFNNFYKILQDNNDKVVVNKNTDIAISRVLIDNSLKNLKYVRDNNLVTDLCGKFPKDVPAIIVAAGPSLDKNIEELKKAKGRAAIFAVDTAMKYLLAHDIIPDFIVTLDPKKSLRHLRDPRCNSIPIFSRIEARTENLQANLKRIIYYNLEGYMKELFGRAGKDAGILNSGGSVATGAFSICETMGIKHIILVGQDLAYSGETTHAGGIKVDVSKAGELVELVEDIQGNTIKTRCDWYIYLRWFEEAVELFEGEEVIDATEGGAKIKGTTIMTFSEAIDKYCTGKVDCDKIITDLKPSFGSDEISRLADIISEDMKNLEIIIKKSKDAYSICERLLNKYEKSLAETTSSKLKNQLLGEYNSTMNSLPIYSLIDWDISAATTNQLSRLYLYSDDEKQDKLYTYRQSKIIYKAILESVERVRPLLEDAYNNLNNN